MLIIATPSHISAFSVTGFFFSKGAGQMKKISFRLSRMMLGNSRLLKAVAFVLFFRHKCGNISTLKNFTINRLHELTGLHSTTIRKRLATLKECGLICVERGMLMFRSLTSKNHARRNMRLSKFCYKTIKDVEYSLHCLLLTIKLQQINFAKSTILKATNGRTHKEVKAARRTARKYGYGRKFIDCGLSYRGIAEFLRTSVSKAVMVIKNAVSRGFVTKKSNFEALFMQNVNHLCLDNYTFTTRNYAYRVKANSYTLAPCFLSEKQSKRKS